MHIEGTNPKKSKKNTSNTMQAIKKSFTENEYLYLFWAFFIPLAVMFCIYTARKVFPFGNNSVLVLDLNGQYVYYFQALRDKILEGGSLLYSWTRTLGGEFMGIFTYYLSSPFSLLVALFPEDMITEALFCIILGKVGLSGLTFGIYLHHSRPSSKFKIVLFSVLYALTAYSVVQAMNTMWIDAVYLLPLVILGLERLIHKKKFLLFTISLAMVFITNYYIGFMVGIFCALYFCYEFFTHYEVDDLKRLGLTAARFAGFVLIAVAIACITVLPAYYSLTFGKTEFQNTDYSFHQRFDFLDFFMKMLPSSYDTVRPEGLPFVYCGMLTLIMAPLYFILPRISKKKKIWSGAILMVMFFSMNSSTIDLFWHGMSQPNWLNYRYSFTFCFLLLLLAYEAFRSIEKINYKWVMGVCAGLLILIFMVQKQDYTFTDKKIEISDIECIWLSIGMLAVYLVALNAFRSKLWKNIAAMFIMIFTCLELFASGSSNLEALAKDVVFSSRSSYVDFIGRFDELTDSIQEQDTGFYRMEKTIHRKVNDPMALGMRGLSNSTSTLNASVINLLSDFGYASRSHWTKYLGGTPVSDSLFGLKYILSDQTVSPLYEEADSRKDITAYKNPYALGIVYGVDGDVAALNSEDFVSPFELMNETVTKMLGENETVELFKPIKFTDGLIGCTESKVSGHIKYEKKDDGKDTPSVTFYITAPNDMEIFTFFPSEYPREVKLTLNGANYDTYFANETRRIVSLGRYSPQQFITLKMTFSSDNLYLLDDTEYFYYLDEALFEEIMPRLQTHNMQIDSYDDTHINGTIDIDEKHDYIFTTIPYDEGWHVQIDGRDAEITKQFNSLLAIDVAGLEAGTHDITFRYMPDIYILGFWLTVGGVLVLILCVIISRKLNRRRRINSAEEAVTVVDTVGEEPYKELIDKDESDKKADGEAPIRDLLNQISEREARDANRGIKDGPAQKTDDTDDVVQSSEGTKVLDDRDSSKSS